MDPTRGQCGTDQWEGLHPPLVGAVYSWVRVLYRPRNITTGPHNGSHKGPMGMAPSSPGWGSDSWVWSSFYRPRETTSGPHNGGANAIRTNGKGSLLVLVARRRQPRRSLPNLDLADGRRTKTGCLS
ncbi:hypothetical protein OPV22_021277 [Ensete ventricosum]|uniref:Uncharacterized protein n=1 Tax=Ensete ventricosum TaxID=4639 RepID=A0AAV8QPW7_ENSVE|nr:hypothetical protein OPV22_021277 [Ensete ventricosum]